MLRIQTSNLERYTFKVQVFLQLGFLSTHLQKVRKKYQKYATVDTVTRTFTVLVYLLFALCLLSPQAMKPSVMDPTYFWRSAPDLLWCSWAALPYGKWFTLVILVKIPSLPKGPQPKEGREMSKCLSVVLWQIKPGIESCDTWT